MPSALEALMAAADGLRMPSESDYPFEPFTWAGPGALTPEALVASLGLPPETPVETRTLERLFAPLTAEQNWMGAEERATCARFAALRAAIAAHLADVAVYRVGAVEIAVLIVGADAGGRLVGLRTTVVET